MNRHQPFYGLKWRRQFGLFCAVFTFGLCFSPSSFAKRAKVDHRSHQTRSCRRLLAPAESNFDRFTRNLRQFNTTRSDKQRRELEAILIRQSEALLKVNDASAIDKFIRMLKKVTEHLGGQPGLPVSVANSLTAKSLLFKDGLSLSQIVNIAKIFDSANSYPQRQGFLSLVNTFFYKLNKMGVVDPNVLASFLQSYLRALGPMDKPQLQSVIFALDRLEPTSNQEHGLVSLIYFLTLHSPGYGYVAYERLKSKLPADIRANGNVYRLHLVKSYFKYVMGKNITLRTVSGPLQTESRPSRAQIEFTRQLRRQLPYSILEEQFFEEIGSPVDLFIPEKKTIIEFDGFRYHYIQRPYEKEPVLNRKDKLRDAILRAVGYQVIRIHASDFDHYPSALVQALVDKLTTANPIETSGDDLNATSAGEPFAKKAKVVGAEL